MNVDYSGNVVEIAGNEVSLAEDIHCVTVFDGVVLVHCETGEMHPTNLVAFDRDGTKLWRIDPLSETDGEFPVKSVTHRDQYVDEAYIQVTNWSGSRYKLDVHTGETEYLGWSR